MSEHEQRLVELEIKLSYTEERVSSLDGTIIEQRRHIDELTAELHAVKEAVRRLAARGGGEGEVLGAYDGDDPVPRSG